MNNLDDEVAEDPQSLVVYGGHRPRRAQLAVLRRIVATLERLDDDQTLLQSGSRSASSALTAMLPEADRQLQPRPKWANWEVFNSSIALG